MATDNSLESNNLGSDKLGSNNLGSDNLKFNDLYNLKSCIICFSEDRNQCLCKISSEKEDSLNSVSIPNENKTTEIKETRESIIFEVAKNGIAPTSNDVGYDIYCPEDLTIPNRISIIDTYIHCKFPKDTYGKLIISVDKSLLLEIPPNYIDHNEIIFVAIKSQRDVPVKIKKGDKIAVLIIEKINRHPIKIIKTEKFSDK